MARGSGRSGLAARPPIQVVDRLARILALFAAGQTEVSIAQIGAELGLSRPSVHRYIRSLVDIGLLEPSFAPGSYRPGPLLVQLASQALGSLEVVERAGPYMRRLAEEAEETVVLSLWGGHGPVVVRVQPCPFKLVQIVVRTGAPLPLNSSQGLVFLAYLPDGALVQRLLAQFPPDVRAEIEGQIEEVRRQGLAISSRVIEGIRAIAVPVFDEQGTIAATMAFVGTTAALPESPDSSYARLLLATAQELSEQLGYRATSKRTQGR